METKERFFRTPAQSFFLFGPRGTGKSTFLRQCFPSALSVDLLSPDVFRSYSARPEALSALIEGHPQSDTIIIDEVQKVPELLSVVHQWIAKGVNKRFILTGSSSRKLKRTGVDLLAGRALLTHMHPFMASELGRDFRLEKAMTQGMLPVVWNSPSPLKVLETYAALYLKEEVQMEGLVRSIGNFSRFLEVVSFSHGSVLNASEIARECQVERKTVEGYISILEDLMLAFRLPVFTRKAKRQLIRHQKFYYFDVGVFSSLRPRGPLDVPEQTCGVALEGLVAQHLRAYAAYSKAKHELFFWRTKSGVEVDFILYGDQFTAIEVKRGASVSSRDVKGLLAFGEDYPQAELVLLYTGKDSLKIKNVRCLPCEHFLKNLKPDSQI